MCAILSHDLMENMSHNNIKLNGIDIETIKNMMIVFIGGYLTAGGANSINMWYDRDIDPIMTRTSKRPLSIGAISPHGALLFGVTISLLGTIWLSKMANDVAAFWALFSILFYTFIYTIWLKRRSTQNIVIGGIAGSTPPVIGWSAAEGNLDISIDSLQEFINSIFDIGGYMPWFMFLLIFLWTPPHFWALALYRSEEYKKVGVPMMPNVKGKQRTLVEMKVYSVALILLSSTSIFLIPTVTNWSSMMDFIPVYLLNILSFGIIGLNTLMLSFWYASTVWKIDTQEDSDENNRMPTASRSFFISLSYLAFMFVVLVLSCIGFEGSILGMILSIVVIFRSRVNKNNF